MEFVNGCAVSGRTVFILVCHLLIIMMIIIIFLGIYDVPLMSVYTAAVSMYNSKSNPLSSE